MWRVSVRRGKLSIATSKTRGKSPELVQSVNQKNTVSSTLAATFPASIRTLFLLGWLAVLTMTGQAVTYTVSNANDSGTGSLRQAILDANTSATVDLIQFQIPGPGPFTINLLDQLPPLTGPVTLDATTQSGYANQPLVELNGTSAGLTAIGVRVTSSGCTIRGLAINRFATDGIRLESARNTVQGNYIGTDVSGTIVRANRQYGVFVLGGWSNTIGGTTITDRNVISGNDTGIYLLNCFGTIVQGNYIGVSASGMADLGNTNNGIVIYAAENNLVGGATTGARNVISGNDGSGINLNTATATGNTIQANYIGLNAAGTASVGNGADGITLNDAAANLIGGPTAGLGNVISGNGHAGIYFNGTSCRGNAVQGNLIGTDASGTIACGNGYAGVTFANAVGNMVGGSIAAARNLISGNLQEGLFLSSGSKSNVIHGNFIGPQINGTTALPNQASGVAVNNAADNYIGGSNAGEGNLISGNGFIGVWLINANATRNLVRGNLIGVAASGSASLGNTQAGVGVSDAGGNQIGGPTSTEANVISGNGFPANAGGLFITGNLARGNKVIGNRIGTSSSGTAALANRYEGVYLVGASSNQIGGSVPGMGNLIAGNTTRGLRITNSLGTDVLGNSFGVKSDGVTSLGNGQFNIELEENTIGTRIGTATGGGNRIGYSGGGYAGVRVRDNSTNNEILGNAIFNNSSLGIDNSTFGVTANDDCDSDGGGNQLQNFPVLTAAYGGSSIGISGTFNSQPNQTYRLQFFASPSCDPSGNGEGEVYLGDAVLALGATCTTNFVVRLPQAVAAGWVVTATATDPANNTSEFSSCLPVLSPPALGLATTPGGMMLSWPSGATGFVLREALSLKPPVNWTLVTNPPTLRDGQWAVTVGPQGDQRFYRLSFE